jgi:hypothetical protein
LTLIDAKQCQKWPLLSKGAHKNVILKNYIRGPIYRKIYAVWKEKVHSIAVRSMCSITRCALDRAQPLQYPTAQPRMQWPRATRGSQEYVDALDRGVLDLGLHAWSQAHSIVSLCAQLHKQGLLASFPSFTAFWC